MLTRDLAWPAQAGCGRRSGEMPFVRPKGGAPCMLFFFATRLGWEPCSQGWQTPLGDLTWPEAVANIQHASFNSVLTRLADRRPDFKGLEHGIDPVDFRSWRRWASRATHAKRAAVNVALGGAWADQRCSEASALAWSPTRKGEGGPSPASTNQCTIGAEMITQLIPMTFFCVKIVRAISNQFPRIFLCNRPATHYTFS